MTRIATIVLSCIVAAVTSLAAEPKLELLGAPTLPDSLKSALESSGYRIIGEDGQNLCDVWLARTYTPQSSTSSGALYPEFANGTFTGVVTFAKDGQDFRGQKIAPGTYTLRYQLLPSDGNHLGVAPNPDFFLLIPILSDKDPADTLPYAELVRLSSRAAGTNHPASFQLTNPDPKSPVVKTDSQGHTVLTFDLRTSGEPLRVGLVLKGTAEQ